MGPKPSSKSSKTAGGAGSGKATSTASSKPGPSSKKDGTSTKGGNAKKTPSAKPGSPSSKDSGKQSVKSKKGSEKQTVESEPDNRPFWKKLLSCFKKPRRRPQSREAPISDPSLLETALGQTEPLEEPPLVLAPTDVKDFVIDWEGNFWPDLIVPYALIVAKNRAATKIQRIIRGFLGRKRTEKLWHEAICEFSDFWVQKKRERENERALKRKLEEERRKFAENTVKKTIKRVYDSQVHIEAVTHIQSAWRGFVTRKLMTYIQSLKKMRSPYKIKKVERKSRINENVKRYIWARRAFAPAGGWPGKADVIDYSMWEHTDEPPKGRDFGLKTYKVKAAPASDRGMDILKSDRNAWVGIPMALVTSAEAKKAPSVQMQRMIDVSPLSAPMIGRQDVKASEVAKPPPAKLKGLAGFIKLGWNASMIDRSISDDAVVEASWKDKSLEITQGGSTAIQHLADSNTIPQDGSFYQSQSVFVPASPTGPVTDSIFGHTQVLVESTFGDNESSTEHKPRGVKKTHDIPGQLQSINEEFKPVLWKSKGSYLDVKLEAEAKRRAIKHPRERDNIEKMKITPWGKIKSYAESMAESKWHMDAGLAPGIEELNAPSKFSADVDDLNGSSAAVKKGKDKLRVTVWPTKPKTHFKLKYTWLPQPMVRDAVEKVYYNEGSNAPIPSIKPTKTNQKLPSNLFNPDYVPPPTTRKGRLAKESVPSPPSSPCPSPSSPKLTVNQKISTIMSNMNSLSVLSSVTDYDGISANSGFSRSGKGINARKPISPTGARPDHPYHWL